MYFEFNECIRDSLFSIVITLQFKNTMQFLFFLLERRNEHSGYQLLLCLGICFIQEVFQKKKIVRFCAPAVIHGRTNSNIFFRNTPDAVKASRGKKARKQVWIKYIRQIFIRQIFLFFIFYSYHGQFITKRLKTCIFFLA